MRLASRPVCGLLACAVLGAAACENPDNFAPDPVERIAPKPLTLRGDLLFHWAPVHYQDVNRGGKNSIGGKGDYITRFDFDNDWTAFNNWDSMSRGGSLKAFAYTDVIDSPTHWFLEYMYYHPRDWAQSCCDDEHENDLEGVMLMIRKDGTPFGHIEAAVAEAHGNLEAYTVDPRVASVIGTDRRITTEKLPNESWARPRTFQEAEGHGFMFCGQSGTKCDKGDEDGIKYLPLPFGVNPGTPPDTVGIWTKVNYSFLGMEELWDKRLRGTSGTDAAGKKWSSWLIYKDDNGLSFRGDNSDNCGGGLINICKIDGADATWSWDGGGLKDPAAYYKKRFNNISTSPGGLSGAYLKNRYLGCADMTQPTTRQNVIDHSCNPTCRNQIFAADSYCQLTEWDSICVSEIESVCHLQIAQ
jgi:hypothetical protein